MAEQLIGDEAYTPPAEVEALRASINAEWSAATDRRREAQAMRDRLAGTTMTAPDKKIPAAIRAANTEIADALKAQIAAIRRYAAEWLPIVTVTRREAINAAIDAEPREMGRLQKALHELGWPLPVEGERNTTRMAIVAHPTVAAARGRADSLRSYAGPPLWPDEVIDAKIARLEQELDLACRAASAAA